jgi:hypothetical protein
MCPDAHAHRLTSPTAVGCPGWSTAARTIPLRSSAAGSRVADSQAPRWSPSGSAMERSSRATRPTPNLSTGLDVSACTQAQWKRVHGHGPGRALTSSRTASEGVGAARRTQRGLRRKAPDRCASDARLLMSGRRRLSGRHSQGTRIALGVQAPPTRGRAVHWCPRQARGRRSVALYASVTAAARTICARRVARGHAKRRGDRDATRRRRHPASGVGARRRPQCMIVDAHWQAPTRGRRDGRARDSGRGREGGREARAARSALLFGCRTGPGGRGAPGHGSMQRAPCALLVTLAT